MEANMCLAVPVRVVSVHGTRARVELSGNVREADLSLVDGARIGDWVLVHAGFAIEKLTPEEAEQTLRLLGQIEDPARVGE
jgi:hydrogenase expression/formation protein HypC